MCSGNGPTTTRTGFFAWLRRDRNHDHMAVMPDPTIPAATTPAQNTGSRILRSAKVWTFISGAILILLTSIIAKLGLDISDETVKQIAGGMSLLLMTLLGSQGLADQGKEAAKINATARVATLESATATLEAPSVAPSSSPTSVAMFIGLLVIGCLAFGVVSCGETTKIIARQGAVDLYDCMRPEVKDTISELGPIMERGIRSTIQNDGTLDRAALKDQARSLKAPALRCAFQTGLATVGRVIAALAGAPQSEGQLVNHDDAKKAFDEVSAELYGGAKFRIAGETL